MPRSAARWLAPRVLVGTGIKSLLAAIFGAYADKRELQGGLPAIIHSHATGEEIWLDYVADLGDGFDATYSVASLLAAPELVMTGVRPLPRAQVLVMGGDQVYPSASTRAYEDRAKGPYRAALPRADGRTPSLFALPGNHDWYDGLTAFLRVFGQRRPFGGWATEQTRSYFAIELPKRWWLLAIDTQFDDYVDGPQLEYFRAVSKKLRDGDSVILATSTPAWVKAGSGRDDKGYDTFEFVMREIVTPSGAVVRVMVSGDKHHYARYVERGGDGQRITCGLGGAYLAATHELPHRLDLPPRRSRVRNPSPQTTFDLAEEYPSRAASRAMAAGIFRLPWRNPGFWALTGTLQTIMTLAVLFGIVADDRLGLPGAFGVAAAWAPAAIVSVLLVLGGMAFAGLDSAGAKLSAAVGVLHAAAHLALSVCWGLVVIWMYRTVWPAGFDPELATLIVVFVGTPLLIGFLDAELVAIYLMLASKLDINLNEVMAGQSIEDHKGFMRMHVGADGSLTIYPVKLPTVSRAWRAVPDGAPDTPWLVPDGPALEPELIEAPIRLEGLVPSVSTQAGAATGTTVRTSVQRLDE